MSRNELQELAKKYMNGSATSNEKELLNQWYNTMHEDQQVEQVEYVPLDTFETEDEIKHKILTKIWGKIELEDKKEEKTGKTVVIKRLAFGIASAAAVILIAGALWYYNNAGTKLMADDTQLVNITTKKITKITLGDGSVVWLNANTTFKYPPNFSGKIREVELVEGRAFFDIKHQPAHPFLVKTQNLNIAVLGTSFDVRTYQREGTTKVNVITGKVGITRPGHVNEPAIMLLPKQQLVLNKVNSRLTKELTHEPVVNLWCKSPLVFEQENLDNVFKAIEKQYNTHIEVYDKQLLNERISITLANQRLDTIMEILSFTKHFNYQIANDSTVVIR
ncbi:MAG: transrane sensor [Mucilaginibacter sp.]|nr:transrane sensor [Mucilaginibacter sp.]